MHSLLARQIRRSVGDEAAIPESLRPLLALIDEAYHQSDEDRRLLERSLDLTSEELLERNEQLRRDNDDLVAGQRAREEALSLLQATLESTADGILVVDRAGRVVSSNGRFAEMWGVPDELLEKCDDRLLVEHARDLLIDPFAFVAGIKALYGHPEKESYDFLELRDGRVFERYSRPQRVDDQCIGRVWSFRDVTERRRAEEAIRRSEERYRRLFDGDLTAIVVARPDGAIEECNPAFLRLFGFASRAEALAANTRDLFRAEDRLNTLTTLTRRERIQDLDTEARRVDGATVHIVATVVGRYDDLGDLDGIMGFFSNQTERRRLEEQLRLSQRLESVGRLAGGIAHDFNNLLTAILGSAALLHEGLQPDDPMRTEAAEIARAGARAADLTRQLLAFGRKQVLDRRPLQLNQVVGDMQRMLRRLIGENIDLRTELAADLGVIEADPTQVEQVVTNLVVNARDAVRHGGGTIVVETANVLVDSIYRERRPGVPEGPFVVLSVSDDGEGIPSDDQERIFEPFYTTKEPGQGTGLGLAVVYGIVKQSGGFIWVYSEPGLGTTFRIYFPRHAAAEAAAPEEPTEPAVADLSGSESILLVEDEPVVRRLAARILRSRGYRVVEVPDPAHALEVVAAGDQPIDLLLTDLVMPGMSGHELARRIRRALPWIGVVYMSGYSESLVQARGLGSENGVYMAKPFSANALLENVRTVLTAAPAPHSAAKGNEDVRRVELA